MTAINVDKHLTCPNPTEIAKNGSGTSWACASGVGFELEAFQVKIAGALLGPEREKLITLPRKNGKSRLVGAFAAWHLMRALGLTPALAIYDEFCAAKDERLYDIRERRGIGRGHPQ